MKIKYSLFLMLFGLLLFSSCSKTKSKTVKSTSPDGKINVEVWGERYTSSDPWSITIKCDQFDDAATTELHASDVSESNVTFNWQSNTKCIVTLIHRDGAVNQVPISIGGQ